MICAGQWGCHRIYEMAVELRTRTLGSSCGSGCRPLAPHSKIKKVILPCHFVFRAPRASMEMVEYHQIKKKNFF